MKLKKRGVTIISILVSKMANASDVANLIDQFCSGVVSSGNSNSLTNMLVILGSVVLIPGSHMIVQLYDRYKYGPSGNTPAPTPPPVTKSNV